MKIQEKIPEKWNFGTHLAFVGVFYSIVYAVSNLICFVVAARKEQKKNILAKIGIKTSKPAAMKKMACGYVKKPPKSCKTLNTVITAMLCIDIASYPLVKKLMEKTYR